MKKQEMMIRIAEVSLVFLSLLASGCSGARPLPSAPARAATRKPPQRAGPSEEWQRERIAKAYAKFERLVQAPASQLYFYPYGKRAICASALLRIADLHARLGERKQAVDLYERAIDEYGDEWVPPVPLSSAAPVAWTVRGSALFSIGLIYKDTGQREKAMEIFAELMEKASDPYIRRGLRTHYLEIKQSHLKLKARVTVLGKKRYTIGEGIPVLVTVENPTEEPVIFRCYAKLRMGTRGGQIASREESEEITLAPGEEYETELTFTRTDGVIPGEYKVTASLTYVAFDTNSETIEIRKPFLKRLLFFLN